MPMILLVVVGAIKQSKYVPMMSLAVVGTLTNHILWVYVEVYAGLRGGLHGSMWVYVEVYAGLRGSTWRSTWVYVGLHRGLHGSMQRSTLVYVGLCGSMWVYAGLLGGLCGSMWVYAGLCRGLHGSRRV